MITKERIKEILSTAGSFGDLKFDHPKAYAYKGGIIHPKGITKEEDEYIKKVWKLLPGHSCYYDAVILIGKGMKI